MKKVDKIIISGQISFIYVDSSKMIEDGKWFIVKTDDKPLLKRLFPHASILYCGDSRIPNKDTESCLLALSQNAVLPPLVIDAIEIKGLAGDKLLLLMGIKGINQSDVDERSVATEAQ